MFDPSAAVTGSAGIFGLPFSEKDAALVLLPVPWEVTTSYKEGTAKGPAAILDASRQIDLFDHELGEFYKPGIYMRPINASIAKKSKALRMHAKKLIAKGGEIGNNAALNKSLRTVNAGSKELNNWVYTQIKELRKKKKIVGLVGGDHSTPFGVMKALVEEYPSMGILQIDAHADLRKAYEGFEDSHASIMYNVLTKLPVKKLVQVGIRDFCIDEMEMIKKEKKRITTFFDADLAKAKQKGKTWKQLTKSIISALPKQVYISFDIDGLEPTLCPHTGTPVPGGLRYHEVSCLIRAVAESGRMIIGFDLNEVAPGGSTEWDGNVGGRLLLKLCGWTLKSQKKL